ncbi:penicillin-binding protein 1B [Gayadomonas joobiniege]|uniref:penicillin-binding protein 1B n=1 Tax=Gayadomonas joobiniege TaxID=1234606 RepID=UPI0003750FB2|nr:penicillin-binding protein 1B [Gayadomonas joobiniege]
MSDHTDSFKRRLFSFFIKLTIVALILLVAIVIYFDAQIKDKFSGQKWQLPAQVFGVAHTYRDRDALTKNDLVAHLELLDYRASAQVRQPGDYKVNTDSVEFIRRAYSLYRETFAEQRLTVSFRKHRITGIVDNEQQTQLSAFTLEPYLLDRLQANSYEDRVLVELQQVPNILLHTLLTIEDRKFFDHHGVSPMAIARAMWVNVQAGRTVQGGSTLTQQLVKNMFLTNQRSLLRKAKEAIMALILDTRYSKEEILQAYLNEVYLGQNNRRSINGVGLASQFYFAKPLNELGAHEIALLIGIIKGPSYYDPRRNPERAKERRDLVLQVMAENAIISPELYQYSISQPLSVIPLKDLKKRRFPAYLDQVKAELARLSHLDTEFYSGLKIYTHFDPLAQNRAQASVQKTLREIEQQRNLNELQAAMLIADSRSGGIKAIVGDRDASYEGFNRALNAQRNIGSLIKPYVFLTALESANSYTLASILQDKPIKLTNQQGKTWAPENFDKKFSGQISLLDALVDSVNVPTVNLGMQIGVEGVIKTLKKFSVKQSIPAYPSVLLGSVTLAPFDVLQMYQALANDGILRKQHAVSAVYSNENYQLWQQPDRSQQIISEKVAYLINYSLNQVTKRGSAKSLRRALPGAQFAGKTGTTNDGRDSWFAGYDEIETAVVWLGKDNNQGLPLTGASGALKVFIDYQKSRTPENLTMAIPEGVEMRYFDKETARHSLPGCKNLVLLPAIVDALPEPKSCADSGQWREPEAEEKTWLERLFGG